MAKNKDIYKKLKAKKTDDSKVGVYRTFAKGFRELPNSLANKTAKYTPKKKLKVKSKVAKGLKVSDKELTRLKKASPRSSQYQKDGIKRTNMTDAKDKNFNKAYRKQLNQPNQITPTSKGWYDSEAGKIFSSEYDRKGSYTNPLKEKPKKKLKTKK